MTDAAGTLGGDVRSSRRGNTSSTRATPRLTASVLLSPQPPCSNALTVDRRPSDLPSGSGPPGQDSPPTDREPGASPQPQAVHFIIADRVCNRTRRLFPVSSIRVRRESSTAPIVPSPTGSTMPARTSGPTSAKVGTTDVLPAIREADHSTTTRVIQVRPRWATFQVPGPAQQRSSILSKRSSTRRQRASRVCCPSS